MWNWHKMLASCSVRVPGRCMGPAQPPAPEKPTGPPRLPDRGDALKWGGSSSGFPRSWFRFIIKEERLLLAARPSSPSPASFPGTPRLRPRGPRCLRTRRSSHPAQLLGSPCRVHSPAKPGSRASAVSQAPRGAPWRAGDFTGPQCGPLGLVFPHER